MLRFFILFVFLSVTLGLPFVFFGDQMTALFDGDGALSLFQSYGSFAWLIAILMLIGDLVLPIPTGAIFGGLGILYGPLLGGFIGAVGSFLSGIIGYALCRRFGHNLAKRVVGVSSMQRGERLFAQSGGWLVAFSRWLPILPEVVACIAGLTRMPLLRFSLALLCGAIPVAYFFAVLGHAGSDQPAITLLICALLPLLLWLIVRPFLGNLERPQRDEQAS